MARVFSLWLLLASLVIATPALAHKGEQHGGDAPAEHSVTNTITGEPMPGVAPTSAAPEPTPSMSARTVNWIGRFHPAVVHFPVALIPLALLAIVMARRRTDKAAVPRFLLIASGITAPLAAGGGWMLAEISSWDADPVMAWHRWIGTFVGLNAAWLGWRAWRNSDSATDALTTINLVLLTVLIGVQGWLGGALVHGTNHLAF